MSLEDVLYADDTLIIGSCGEHVEEYMRAVEHVGAQYGLTVHWGKVQAVSVCTERKLKSPLGVELPNLDRTMYLGSNIQADGKFHLEVGRKIGNAAADFKSLSRIWKHAAVGRRRKLELFDACVISKLCYATASAWLNKADFRKLDGYHARCLRIILGIKPAFYSRVSNDRIRELAGQPKLSSMIRKAQWSLLHKVITDPTKRELREVAFHKGDINTPATYAWVKRRGRPRQDWTHQLMQMMKQAAGYPQDVNEIVERWEEDVFSRGKVKSKTNAVPRRDRLPCSTQQFPALASSGIMSSTHVQHARENTEGVEKKNSDGIRRVQRFGGMAVEGEDKPLPFKHCVRPHLLERRFFDSEVEESNTLQMSPTTQKDVVDGKAQSSTLDKKLAIDGDARHEIAVTKEKAPRSRLSSLKGRFMKSKAREYRKAASKASIGLREEDGTSIQRDQRKGIWNIHLDSTKDDRMDRLTAQRKLKETELLVGDRDKVATRDEIELAEDSFSRHFKIRKFDTKRLIEALNDFGIRARSQPEKAALFKIMDDYADKDEVTFKDFCAIVEETRVKFRACRYTNIFLTWRLVDTDDVGALDVAQVMQLLHDLNLGPKDANDKAMIESYIEQLHTDSFGVYALGEVEQLVQKCREYFESARRRMERKIQADFSMSKKTFSEFRNQLIEFNDEFKRMDNNTGNISIEGAMFLLAEFGIITQCKRAEKDIIRNDLEDILKEAGLVTVVFPWFLMFVRSLRKRLVDLHVEHVKRLFALYDKDRSGELDMKEVCLIIRDLNLLPRSSAEQDGIAELLEEVDEDGSGNLGFDEVLLMVVRIAERTQCIQRKLESAKAESLHFTRHQTFELRCAFESLDVDSSGSLTYSEVVRAVHLAEPHSDARGYSRVSDAKIMQMFDDVDTDDSGAVDFSEFLELMYKIDADVKAAMGDERPGESEQSKKTDASVSLEEEQIPKNQSPSKPIRREKKPMAAGESRRPELRKQATRSTFVKKIDKLAEYISEYNSSA